MGFLYVSFCGGFLYVVPAVLLCRKVAAKTTARPGWAMAFLLLALPAILLTASAVIDAHGAAATTPSTFT
ncbi:hypothetical protein ACFVYD_29690 [Streptomyces sp. NPDC058301]|uniref:hypothetical protein n=1 Tax=Streptomyces sp. NPDC058301 TaxID=3346436 RepID=UPI0036ED10DB